MRRHSQAIIAMGVAGATLLFGGVRSDGTPGVWRIPEGVAADARTQWTSVEKPVPRAALGAVAENGRLRILAAIGADGVRLESGASGRIAEFRILDATGQTHPLSATEIVSAEMDETVLRVWAGTVGVDIQLAAGDVFAEIRPGDGAEVLEVGFDGEAAVLPDFFGDDTVFLPAKFESDDIVVPAENFLLGLLAGNRAMLLCVWPGPLETNRVQGRTLRDPEVRLLFAGAGADRRVAAARFEFLKQPVYLGVLEHPDIWHIETVTDWAAWKPTTIEWKRPFEAQWRASFMVADGKVSKDWRTRSQSFPFRGPVKEGEAPWWHRKGTQERPTIYQEALSHIIYPCWFDEGKTRLSLYADVAERQRVGKINKAAQKKNKEAPELYPTNIYEAVLVYPLERAQDTPLDVFLPVDVMRSTLGQGPCEYVLDLEGIKPRPDGGDRPLLENATCPLWDNHVFPILSRNVKRLKEGEKLDAATEERLVHALEDLLTFVHAVHDRIREYRAWCSEMEAFCQDKEASAGLKPLASKILVDVRDLRKRSARFDGNRTEGPRNTEGYWHGQIARLVEQVKAGRYDQVHSAGGIRTLGNQQDHMVAICRRYVKGIRQEAMLTDAQDPELREFLAEIRNRCGQILRRQHEKEGL